MAQSGFQYMVQRGKSAALRMADRLTPVLKVHHFYFTFYTSQNCIFAIYRFYIIVGLEI